MRGNLLILVVLIVCAAFLAWNDTKYKGIVQENCADSSKSELVCGVSGRGLRMEFVRSRHQAILLLGDPIHGTTDEKDEAKANWHTMRVQQIIDGFFIVLYVALFVSAVSAPMRRSSHNGARLLGWSVFICILVAGAADYAEDAAVWHTLNLQTEDAFHPHSYAMVKWTLFYLALGISSLFLLLYPKLGDFGEAIKDASKWLRRIAGFFYLIGSVIGCIGVIQVASSNNAHLLPLAFGGVVLGAPLFLLSFIVDLAPTKPQQS
jgi:hypothetical protein